MGLVAHVGKPYGVQDLYMNGGLVRWKMEKWAVKMIETWKRMRVVVVVFRFRENILILVSMIQTMSVLDFRNNCKGILKG